MKAHPIDNFLVNGLTLDVRFYFWLANPNFGGMHNAPVFN